MQDQTNTNEEVIKTPAEEVATDVVAEDSVVETVPDVTADVVSQDNTAEDSANVADETASDILPAEEADEEGEVVVETVEEAPVTNESIAADQGLVPNTYSA